MYPKPGHTYLLSTVVAAVVVFLPHRMCWRVPRCENGPTIFGRASFLPDVLVFSLFDFETETSVRTLLLLQQPRRSNNTAATNGPRSFKTKSGRRQR